jgi:hypothetical protein
MRIIQVLFLLLITQIVQGAVTLVPNPPVLAQPGGTLSVSSSCYKIDEAGIADCVQTQLGKPYKCQPSRFAPLCKSTINTYFKSTGEIFTPAVVNRNFNNAYPGTGWITYWFNGEAYGCQQLQAVGSGGSQEKPTIRGCGKFKTFAEVAAMPKDSDNFLLAPSESPWPAPWLFSPHLTAGNQLWSSDENKVTDVSSFGFVVSDVQVGNFAYYMHPPLLCAPNNTTNKMACSEIGLPNLGINDFGDFVGGTVATINQVQYNLAPSTLVSGNDINNAGFIAGQCLNMTALTGCIAKVDEPVS